QCPVIGIHNHQPVAAKQCVYQEASGICEITMREVRFFDHFAERLRVIRQTEHFPVGTDSPSDRIRLHPTGGSDTLHIPNDLLAKQIRMVDLFEIMIFGGHPINRNETVIRIGLLQVAGKTDRSRYLEYKIQRPCENIELMTSGDRKRFLICERMNVFSHLGSRLEQSVILRTKPAYQRVPIRSGLLFAFDLATKSC